MLSRDQVLHVARLARLELTEAEVERMAGELSGVLAPHRQDLRARARRRTADLARGRGPERPARRRAAPVAAARGGARGRARPGRDGLPRAQPGCRAVSGLIDLTAAQAGALIRTGVLDAGELWSAYRERALADELNAFSWVSDEVSPPPVVQENARAGRRARWRSRTSSARTGSPARPGRGSSRATARPTPPRWSSAWRRRARRCWARPTRTSSRWAPRPSTARSAPS